MEIKPTKLVKGQDLARMLDDSNCQALGLHVMAEEIAQEEEQAALKKEKIMDFY